MKKLLKGLLCAGLAIAMATPFISCKKEVEGPIELTIWTHEDQNRTALEKRFIEEFQTANPNVKVNYVTYPSGKIKDILVAGFPCQPFSIAGVSKKQSLGRATGSRP